jgi:tetratricopeptide (TPR) repeat protein
MKKQNWFLLLALISILLNSCAHLKEARLAYQEKKYDRAVHLLKEAIAADSTDADAYLLLSKTYSGMHSPDSALRYIEKAMAFHPDSKKIIDEYSSIRIQMGDRFLSQGKKQRALIQYRSAEPLDSTRYALIIRIADLYHDLALLEKAEVRYNRLLKLYPDSARARIQLLEIRQRTERAVTLYTKGMSAFHQEKLIPAKSYFSDALKEKADLDDAKYYLFITDGRLLYKKGSMNALWDAIEAFGNALSIRENSAESQYWLAKAYEKKDSRDFTNTIQHYETALQLEPNGPFSEESAQKLQELKKRKAKLDAFFGREN